MAFSQMPINVISTTRARTTRLRKSFVPTVWCSTTTARNRKSATCLWTSIVLRDLPFVSTSLYTLYYIITLFWSIWKTEICVLIFEISDNSVLKSNREGTIYNLFVEFSELWCTYSFVFWESLITFHTVYLPSLVNNYMNLSVPNLATKLFFAVNRSLVLFCFFHTFCFMNKVTRLLDILFHCFWNS